MQDLRKPICIASPVRRSGTTLIQRLLSSAPNALIYGESCANDFQMLAGIYANKESLLLHAKDWRNDQLAKVLNGSVNDWIPDLMPDIDYFLSNYKKILYALVENYGGYAQEQGRSVWGMKMPEWHPGNLNLIRQLLPGTKIIYLHRILEDCVRSAKGIEMVINEQELRQFCHIWKQYRDFALANFQGDEVLHLHYEDLLKAPEQWITKLETFSGAVGIQASVLDVRVNTYANDQRLQPEEHYLKPAVLSEEEQNIIAEYV